MAHPGTQFYREERGNAMYRHPLTRPAILPPSSPPPVQTPEYCAAVCGVGVAYIPQQMHHYIYLWTASGNSFWAYPLGIRDDLLIAYIWDNDAWQLAQINLSVVDSIY